MKSGIKALALLVAPVSFAVYATIERGEWAAGIFVFNLLASFFITGFLYLIGSCCERQEMKGVVFIIYIVVMGVFLDRSKELKQRDVREREARRIQQEKYQMWYNSLTPYEKLEVENQRLREENSALQHR